VRFPWSKRSRRRRRRALVDKNLARVNALIEELTPTDPPPMAWEPDEAEPTGTSLPPTEATRYRGQPRRPD
jgi:hypothetical protein